MSDEKNTAQERPDEPDAEQVLTMTDIARNMCVPVVGGQVRAKVMGSTDFEDKDLEEMRALVGDARPEDIETAAGALWDAAGKIKEIGDDLKTHIDKVDWEGEFGDSFRAWGRDLSKNTLLLGDYTERASLYLKAAGSGLASVKKAIPDADPTTDAAPRLEKIPLLERVDTNPTYRLAKKKEENRQEAINQMNRLTSYYRVSHENMQTEEEPKFGPMPSIGMPDPPPMEDWSQALRTTSSATSDGSHTPGVLLYAGNTQRGPQETPAVGALNVPFTPDRTLPLQQDVRTDLNSVALPAAPSADSGPRTALPPANGAASSGTGLAIPPAYTVSGKRLGRAPGVTGSPVPGARDGGGGRVPGSPNAPGSNATARPVTGSGATSVGRSPAAAAPPVGRGNGIVGGTPQRNGAAANSPRLPRGTVIGAESGMMGRPPAGTGGAGASGVGSGSTTSGRRLASNPGGTVGAPRSTPTQGAVPRPFTPGGTGLTRSASPGGGQNTTGVTPRTGTTGSRDQPRDESHRPDYLVEDEETWTAGRNSIVPPVVD